MGWFGFGGMGSRPVRRSYHARGGVSRALSDGAPDGPQTVEDVVRNQGFWRQHRGVATAFYLLGLLGLALLFTTWFNLDGATLGVGTWILGAGTLLMFLMPTGLWIRFQRQRRRFEQAAQETSAHEEVE